MLVYLLFYICMAQYNTLKCESAHLQILPQVHLQRKTKKHMQMCPNIRKLWNMALQWAQPYVPNKGAD